MNKFKILSDRRLSWFYSLKKEGRKGYSTMEIDTKSVYLRDVSSLRKVMTPECLTD